MTTHKEWLAMGPRNKCRYLLSYITIEPILICYVFPMVLSGMAVRNLNLEKACRVNLAYNDTVCDALSRRETSGLETLDDNVHILVTKMAIWKNPLHSAIPAFLVLFLGSWSDRRARRKPCLVVPIVGQIFTSIGLILCWYFYYEWPLEAACAIEAVLPSITGGILTVIMATFSYIYDITSAESRTFRIGVVSMLVTLGIPVGTALSGILLKPLGYYGMFSLTAGMYSLGFVYGLLCVKETRDPVPRPEGVGFFRDFFDYHHVLETVTVVFKRREGNKRKRLILLLIISALVHGVGMGEAEHSYAFVRKQFLWNEVHFSYFATYSIVVHLVGTVIAVGLLSKILKVHDALLGMISCISKAAAAFVFAFSTKPWHFYIGPVVEIISGAALITMRSLTSKAADADEFGKVNSFFGVFDAFAPIIFSPIFSVMYANTIDVMAGAFYLLVSCFTVPSIIIFMCLYVMYQKDPKSQEEDNKKTESDSKDCNKTDNVKKDWSETENEKTDCNNTKNLNGNQNKNSVFSKINEAFQSE